MGRLFESVNPALRLINHVIRAHPNSTAAVRIRALAEAIPSSPSFFRTDLDLLMTPSIPALSPQ